MRGTKKGNMQELEKGQKVSKTAVRKKQSTRPELDSHAHTHKAFQ